MTRSAIPLALADYRAGNLASVARALTTVGAHVRLARTAADLHGAAGIVVPGVGHFGATMALDDVWRDALREALTRGVPLLGICLGLQWLCEGSEEASGVPGLGVFPGVAAHMGRDDESAGRSIKVPHVGWNTLDIVAASWLLAGVETGATAYFTHSYAVPPGPATVATSTHGRRFTAAAESGHVAAVQFHPEKSGRVGLTILENFVRRAGGM